MALQKFKVGQTLTFSPLRRGDRDRSHSCKVVQLMPIADGEYQYRIKCIYDNIELIVKESQLVRQH
ncbi:MAG: hypothetical protein ACR2PG_24875 [Hyphomicrobiaceae bacterium]